MRTYGQYCPIARASELLAERWTPIIVRNLLLGCTTFNQIAAGAPGLSRALLTKRLRELKKAGVIDVRPKPDGHGSVYEVTQAGRELWRVLNAMGDWAERWMEVSTEHSEPDVVLWSWCNTFLRRDRLPAGTVLVRFEFDQWGRRVREWLLVQDREGEICSFDPGFEEDLIVTVHDANAFARWHLGHLGWADAVRSGAIEVLGDRPLARALPTWNAGPQIHAQGRDEHVRARVSRNPHEHIDALPHPLTVSPLRAAKPATEIPGFEGPLITPDDAGYDEARVIWNGAIDRRPALIAGCASAADVVAALRHARDRALPVSVRGGGHGVAGTSVCDEGVVIDLSPMKAIEVDPGRRTARAAAGLLWGELDAATQAFGLATTGGVVSHTGIAGLTLGGGIGWLMRRHGLTIDNLLSAEVVLADGTIVTASEEENADLFWALRGGGGGVGIVTSFTYRLHAVGPEVLAGPVFWALEDAPDVLRFYRDFAAEASREVNTVVMLRKAPPLTFLPVELRERPVCMISMLALGDIQDAERELAPMRRFGRPLLDLVNPRAYIGLQSIVDATVPRGWHYYWKSAELGALEDPLIDVLVDRSADIASPWSYSVLFQLGGAVADVDEDATAYSNRGAAHNLNINGVWLPHQPIADHETAWTRRTFAAVEPYQTGVYSNFLDRDEPERVRAAYGDRTFERLMALKAQHDPDGVFGFGQNVPAGTSPVTIQG